MERVLTLRELNRTTLLRQLLLGRARLRLSAAIERLGALQAQWAPSPYVALWSRLEDFRRGDLERALRRDAVVKATLMRATLHLVSGRDYGAFAAAVRDAQIAARTRGVERPDPGLVERARVLARERPVTRRDLHALLGHEGPARPDTDPRILRQVHWLLALARLEQTPECALWSPQRVTTFRVLEAEEPEPLEARKHLVRRYLAAFGARIARRPLAVERRRDSRPRAVTRGAAAPPAPRRERPRARRPPAGADRRGRRAGAGSPTPALGGSAPRVRPARADPPRRVPPRRDREERRHR